MKQLYKVLALIPVMTVFSCTDLHKDPVGLLTPDQVSTDPTLSTVTNSVTSAPLPARLTNVPMANVRKVGSIGTPRFVRGAIRSEVTPRT